jgi:hypothetical protein
MSRKVSRASDAPIEPRSGAPDLTNVSEVDLLQAVVTISLRNPTLTAQDQAELQAINQEIKRRENLVYLPNVAAIRRYRDKHQ